MNHVLFLVLKTCQNPKPGDAKVRDISLAAKHSPHQSKKVKMLGTVFNIQTIGCYSFQGSHSICFSFSWSHQFYQLIFTEYYYQLIFTET